MTKMSADTLKALKGSIAKWEAIVAGDGADEGRSNCPLCARFFGGLCEGCPVRQVTGCSRCDGSPYDAWDTHHEFAHDGAAIGADGYMVVPDCPECTRLAQAELDFLLSLLPEGEKT